MADPVIFVIFAAGTLAVMVVTAAALRVWRDLLSLKRLELGRNRSGGAPEINELRHRIRRLESIADGEV